MRRVSEELNSKVMKATKVAIGIYFTQCVSCRLQLLAIYCPRYVIYMGMCIVVLLSEPTLKGSFSNRRVSMPLLTGAI